MIDLMCQCEICFYNADNRCKKNIINLDHKGLCKSCEQKGQFNMVELKNGKEIQMRDLVNFCESYNSIGFGTAKIIELTSKIIIRLYNACYSENEELDFKFQRKYKSNIIIEYHPITIAEFSKLNLQYNTHVVGFENLKDWCDCYENRDEFVHKLKIS